MGTQERRERERKQIRQTILDAALAIIMENGFAGLSMRKLAERVEYSPAALYLHFESREQIARELSEIGYGRFLQELGDACEGKSAADALFALSAAYIAFGLGSPQLYRLILMGDSDYVAAAYAGRQPDSAAVRAHERLTRLAAQLEGAAPQAGVKAAVLADVIWANLHGIVSLHITCAALQSASPADLARQAAAMLCESLHIPTS